MNSEFVRLRYRPNECYDEEMDMLDALRQVGADNFTMDQKKAEELWELREDLFRIDDALERLMEAKPEMVTRYQEQHRHAENQIAKQILRIGLHDVRAA